MSSGLVVRGVATAEEVAAVLAVLSRTGETAEDGYLRWRATRRRAVREDPLRPV